MNAKIIFKCECNWYQLSIYFPIRKILFQNLKFNFFFFKKASYSRHQSTINYTAQKMKFSIKDFLSKCDQIHRKLRIWSYLLKKFLIENFIFCAVLEKKDLPKRDIHLEFLTTLMLSRISSCTQMSFKIGILKDFAKFTEKNLCWSLFLIKLYICRPATLLKRDSSAEVFLWILQNFYEYLFKRAHPDDSLSSSKFIKYGFWCLPSFQSYSEAAL